MTVIPLQHPQKYRSKIFRFVKAIEEQVFLILRGVLYSFFQALNIISGTNKLQSCIACFVSKRFTKLSLDVGFSHSPLGHNDRMAVPDDFVECLKLLVTVPINKKASSIEQPAVKQGKATIPAGDTFICNVA